MFGQTGYTVSREGQKKGNIGTAGILKGCWKRFIMPTPAIHATMDTLATARSIRSSHNTSVNRMR